MDLCDWHSLNEAQKLPCHSLELLSHTSVLNERSLISQLDRVKFENRYFWSKVIPTQVTTSFPSPDLVTRALTSYPSQWVTILYPNLFSHNYESLSHSPELLFHSPWLHDPIIFLSHVPSRVLYMPIYRLSLLWAASHLTTLYFVMLYFYLDEPHCYVKPFNEEWSFFCTFLALYLYMFSWFYLISSR